MKLAAAAYPLEPLTSWADYAQKLEHWVADAASSGAALAVFPEYAAMELAGLAGPDVAAGLDAASQAVSDLLVDVDDLHADLAKRYGIFLLAGSAPYHDRASAPVNRARLFGPGGDRGHQDKLIPTPFERDPWGIAGGTDLTLFETDLGKIGILICYDAEFPLLANTLGQADLLLVPSCTETRAGYWRVRIGAMARALENQCITVMSSTVGAIPQSPAVDKNCGAGGVFAPPDHGFPDTGILAAGQIDQPGWTLASFDPQSIAHVRSHGHVRNQSHWPEQSRASKPATILTLR